MFLMQLYPTQDLPRFFDWCLENAEGFEAQDCDESLHYYNGDVFVGGFAGDTGSHFLADNEEAVQLFQAYKREVQLTPQEETFYV
ncbi:hypothetical protein A6E01_20410 (plasmid) [Vibrio breoganii]|uniref:Uncharacterized protein n=1 Tax=Vibrio breoganii TaxID=553239 RepID=A0AAN0XZS2_9VIBR|nr:hypothetical protein [Vibrio breoganii]ANO35578.1 hypothetical protein A6E01_20410 [Vibrio breoganii]PML15839.1 hypothetical protein BCT84_07500 [Vibrio breoganii]